MAKKSVSDQMELFEDGGFRDQGNTKDPVSNNPVPVGSTQQEVRDDIPANLSEGEFVLPADVVRYHGLEKIMGIRDQAKDGLQKMEQMGQMGNSDQATIPDGVPFKQMALGGTVVNPAIQQPKILPQLPNQSGGGVTTTTPPIVKKPSTYVPPVQPPSDRRSIRDGRLPNYQGPQYRNVPTVGVGTKPTYDDLLGTQFGQLQDSVTKKYVNAETGEVMYIPFVNGKPIYPIPIGFALETEVKAEEAKEDPTKAVRSTSVRQEDNNDSPDNTNEQEQDYKVAMQLAQSEAKAKGTTGILGKLMETYKTVSSKLPAGMIIDDVLNKMNPDRAFSQGPVSDIYGDDYITDANQKEMYAKQSGYTSLDAMTKQYGVEPSFKFGTKPGDVSLVTGKPYDFAGQSRKKDGTIAYSGWDAWTDDLSDSFDTGWHGGFMTEAEIVATKASSEKRYSGSTWNRSKIDAYKDKVAERKGGYIDKTMVDGKKGPNYGNFVSLQDQTKNQLNITAKNLGLDPKGINTGDLVASIDAKRAENKRDRDKDNKKRNESGGNPTTEQGLTDSSVVDNPTGKGDSRDISQDIGWTAKGGFINKRTMTMSKVSPNKKKRGGLASRK
jgi:hypothetical protein